LVSDDPAGEEAGCEGPGLVWSVVLRPVGRITKFSKTMLEVAYDKEINITLSGNSSGGHSCVLCDRTINCRVACYSSNASV
jgi:hypothetical protein